jgi:hypothetical protein
MNVNISLIFNNNKGTYVYSLFQKRNVVSKSTEHFKF